MEKIKIIKKMKTDTQTVKLIEKQMGFRLPEVGGWRKEELGGVAKGTNFQL